MLTLGNLGWNYPTQGDRKIRIGEDLKESVFNEFISLIWETSWDNI
jgi:hypothetical protein